MLPDGPAYMQPGSTQTASETTAGPLERLQLSVHLFGTCLRHLFSILHPAPPSWFALPRISRAGDLSKARASPRARPGQLIRWRPRPGAAEPAEPSAAQARPRSRVRGVRAGRGAGARSEVGRPERLEDHAHSGGSCSDVVISAPISAGSSCRCTQAQLHPTQVQRP